MSANNVLRGKAATATRARARRQAKRDAIWPMAETLVFQPKLIGGWTQMPRTVPMIAGLIDRLGGKHEAGRLYVTLWGHDYGDGFIEVPDPEFLATEVGYSAARAERTFVERMRVLRELGFIHSARLGTREFGFVLLADPHRVVAGLRWTHAADFTDEWLSAFEARCANVGIPVYPPVPPAPTRWTVKVVGAHADTHPPSLSDGTSYFSVTKPDFDIASFLLGAGRAVLAEVSVVHPDTGALVTPPMVLRVFERPPGAEPTSPG